MDHSMHKALQDGFPLVTLDGHALGTLCVMDSAPRELNADQRQALRVLARHVVGQLELRRQARELAQARQSGDEIKRELAKVRAELATARKNLSKLNAAARRTPRKPARMTQNRR